MKRYDVDGYDANMNESETGDYVRADEALDNISALTGERDAALHRVAELEKDRDEAQQQVPEGYRIAFDSLPEQIKKLVIGASLFRDERDERSLLALERGLKLDELTAERDELRQRLDTMAATMFPIEPPKTLRHPQLLDPPSICPSCKNKSWERYTLDHMEPEYRCLSCGWPTKGDA